MDILITGIIMGTFYALLALGLSLIFGILKIVNFAHGEFFMIGAYAYALIALRLKIPPFLALLPVIFVGMLLGVVIERLLMRPLYQKYTEWGAMRDEYAIIVTFGLSLFLMNLANQIFGPYAISGPGLRPLRERIILGDIVMMSSHRILAFGVGAGILIIAYLLLRYSPWGKVIQAVSQNRFGASIAGINSIKVSAIVFGISGVLAGLSGALLCPIFSAEPFVGALPAVKSFVIVVLGGMGSVPGSILGAYLLGVLEQFGAVYISYTYRDTFGFLILIVVLLLRPQGIFGEKAREV
ncbi:MAG: branched-chain amino acid ABC transporter permease [Deltaproteobacteria bacterium]|nr:MAG: branched-chain amino acid ABC transporter permease [Deltaproteobacteria bacterium]